MRSIGHWTPRYILSRFIEIIYQRMHPDYPWLTKSANSFLTSWLRENYEGLEFGSGRSTIWFAERINHLTSVEHNREWYQWVNQQIEDRQISNVNYFLIEEQDSQDREYIETSKYVAVARQFENDSLDFALVDGILRGPCALMVTKKIKPGGILVVDNANWFLPCVSHSPGSRINGMGPADSYWNDFLMCVKEWHCWWTSSGVTDTAIYYRE